MCFCKSRELCLKRGYLTGNEPNLRSNSVLWSAAINHPIQVINVLLESIHIVKRHLTQLTVRLTYRRRGGW